jgi:hypothetical protein
MPRTHFPADKPLHENAGQIGVSFEQLGAVTILEAFDWRSNILICYRNRQVLLRKWTYRSILLDYYSRRCILPILSRGYRLPPGTVQNPTESA